MKSSFRKFFSAKNIATLAVLMALVVVLQSVALVTSIFLPTSLSLVLIPIVLGAMLLGPLAGGVLGFLFGFVVLIFGIAGVDKFTAALLADTPAMTVLICFVKGIAAGVVPGLLYKPIAKKNKLAAAIVAALSAPIVNTGLFIVGCLMITGTIGQFTATGTMNEIVYFLFIGCAGINFLIEVAINIVLSPAIHRIVLVVEKNYANKKGKAVSTEENEETGEGVAPTESSETENKS